MMTNQDQPNTAASDVVSRVAGMMDQVSTIADAVAGYYNRLTGAGIPEAAAAQMAVDFHAALMTHMARKGTPANPLADALAQRMYGGVGSNSSGRGGSTGWRQ